MRILVVGDQRKLAQYLERGLTERGNSVDIALDGIEGRHLALELPYDLVVLDVRLPRLDGFELLMSLADLEPDPVRRRAQRAGRRLALTAQEFSLLFVLLRHRGEVLSRTERTKQLWDMSFDSDSNAAEVAIRRLRAKLDDPFAEKLLHTVRGMGYVLECRGPDRVPSP